MTGIGMLNESPLHAALKQWYARPGDRLEMEVDGFVVDIVRGEVLIEIQTGHFAAIRSKLTSLLQSHSVRVVYPITQDKWIVRPRTARSRSVMRRRSPKRGRLHDLFWELVSIPQLLSHPRFSFELLVIQEEETWRYAGKRQWRRHGWGVAERRLLGVLDQQLFSAVADWRGFLPRGLGSFTTRELAHALGIGTRLAQSMAYCFHRGNVIELAGRQGRANLYRVGGDLK